jgi:hypothetical protein
LLAIRQAVEEPAFLWCGVEGLDGVEPTCDLARLRVTLERDIELVAARPYSSGAGEGEMVDAWASLVCANGPSCSAIAAAGALPGTTEVSQVVGSSRCGK